MTLEALCLLQQEQIELQEKIITELLQELLILKEEEKEDEILCNQVTH